MYRWAILCATALLCAQIPCGAAEAEQFIGYGQQRIAFHAIDFTRDGRQLDSHAAILSLKGRLDDLSATLAGLRSDSSHGTAQQQKKKSLRAHEEAVNSFSEEIDAVSALLSELCDPITSGISEIDREAFALRERLQGLHESLGQVGAHMDVGIEGAEGLVDGEASAAKARAALTESIRESAVALEAVEVRWARFATARQLCTQLTTFVGSFPQQLAAVRSELRDLKAKHSPSLDSADL